MKNDMNSNRCSLYNSFFSHNTQDGLEMCKTKEQTKPNSSNALTAETGL